ncbi:MAG: sensor histidine kinase [Betaproteobacteria bacterium]|nr:sensor histidine kinase [Betaproteobacteria bacterium]
MSGFRQMGSALRGQHRWLLVALLAIFHLVLLAGAHNPLGLILWVAHVGLFFLWQPFVDAEAKLDVRALALIGLILAGGAWLFGWWLLIIWSAALASLVGGRVMFVEHRPTRVFYLLAFAYLLATLLVWLVPKVVPDAALVGPSLDKEFAWGMPLLFALMVLLPGETPGARPPNAGEAANPGVVDFFYSLFLFLLIAVLVLGALAFMLLRQTAYIEAVFKTLISLAFMLFLIAWAWNPQPGFSGMGVFFSRYLLTLGLPFEQWLHRLAVHSGGEAAPELFLARALEDLRQLPWVEGGSWIAETRSGGFGEPARYAQEFPAQPLCLTLFTRHPLSPALAWHFQLLVGLVNEYYLAKQRERELQQVSYLRAVYETGARLTHDVKNLLQSLNNLCYLAQTTSAEDAGRVDRLFQRQLLQITQRLQQTMGKLQKPQGENGEVESVEVWWAVLQQRYANDAVEFYELHEFGNPSFETSATLPTALFDSVVDNLLQNALAKRQGESALKISVALSSDASMLRVCDDGSPLADELLADLLRAPVASENGLGIGLYQAARQAVGAGYRLQLASNLAGEICFELRRNDA